MPMMVEGATGEVNVSLKQARLMCAANAMEWPVAGLALLVVPALLLEDRATSPGLLTVAYAINWTVWLAFVAEFLVRWRAEPQFVFRRHAWFDLALIVVSPPFLVPQALQGARGLRAARILRLLRLTRAFGVASIGLRLSHHLFGRRKFHYTILVAAAIVVLSALGMYAAEHGLNHDMDTVGDSLWWAMLTATTVGVSGSAPTTPEGRGITLLLMLTGIAVAGIFTATLASMFLEDHHHETRRSVDARLDAIEEKLDRLLEQQVESGKRT
jgi:voltage-gated potassium channel